MTMTVEVLFFGFPVDSLYLRAVEGAPVFLQKQFFSGEDPVLSKVQINGLYYIGKPCQAPVSKETLDKMKDHIYSVLDKLVPGYSYAETDLYLCSL